MMGDVIKFFKTTKPAANQKYVQKNRIETSTYHSVTYTKSWSANHVFLGYAILQSNVWEIRT